jgi:hypothetical protein
MAREKQTDRRTERQSLRFEAEEDLVIISTFVVIKLISAIQELVL